MFVLRAVDGDALGGFAVVAHHSSCQLLNTRSKRGAEHHGLLTFFGELVDRGEIIGEAQIEHTVCFIEHEAFHAFAFDLAVALQIKQAAWRGDHEIGVLQFGNLNLIRQAANHVGHAHAGHVASEFNRVVSHLLRQLARGAEDEGLRGGSAEVAGVNRVFAFGLLGSHFAFGGGFFQRFLPSEAFFALAITQLGF